MNRGVVPDQASGPGFLWAILGDTSLQVDYIGVAADRTQGGQSLIKELLEIYHLHKDLLPKSEKETSKEDGLESLCGKGDCVSHPKTG